MKLWACSCYYRPKKGVPTFHNLEAQQFHPYLEAVLQGVAVAAAVVVASAGFLLSS